MSSEEAKYHADHGVVDITPSVALSSGQVVQLDDGRAGVIGGLKDVAVGDPAAAIVEGRVEVLKASGITLDAGDQAWWDSTNNVATYQGGGDFLLGTVVKDAAAGDSRVIVDVNQKPVYAIELPDDVWTTEATDGLGVTEAQGVQTLAFDAVAEVAQAALYSAASIPVTAGMVFEARVAIFNIGDHAALDINIGLANASHATDADAITESAFFHLDGGSLDINCESDDGTTEVAATDSTVDAVDDTYLWLKIDARDKTDVKFYINGVRVLSGSTFKLDAASGPLFPIAHIEKTSNDTVADVRVDQMRVRTSRGS